MIRSVGQQRKPESNQWLSINDEPTGPNRGPNKPLPTIEAMTSDRVMFVVEYEDGRTAEFSIDRWTLSLGDYAARIIARERQEKGDLPPGAIRTVRQI
jgi:hypothetical protein